MTDRLSIDALEDLASQFRQLGANDAQRAGKRRRQRKVLLAAVVVAAALSATAVAAVDLLDAGDPVASDPGAFSADQRPLAGSARLAGVQVADPSGGLPWGLRLSRNAAGDPCYTVGRVYRGQLGVVAGNAFRPLPELGPQKCVHFTRDRPVGLGATVARTDGQLRTIVDGVASNRIISIDVILDRHQPITVVPDRSGAFLLVAAGEPSVSYVVHHRNGTKDILTPGQQPRIGVAD